MCLALYKCGCLSGVETSTFIGFLPLMQYSCRDVKIAFGPLLGRLFYTSHVSKTFLYSLASLSSGISNKDVPAFCNVTDTYRIHLLIPRIRSLSESALVTSFAGNIIVRSCLMSINYMYG